MQITLFHLFHQNRPPQPILSQTEPTMTQTDPAPFSYNPTVLGHRYWIKGNAHILENGDCVAYAETVFNKNLGLCQQIIADTPLADELTLSISHHLKAHTFKRNHITNYSIHF
jgi:hypothetical protein